jgi:biopolymer transport protein TolR
MGMSTGGGKGGRAPMSEINVTPLVDVMLVLLIIFMITAPMLTTGVEVDLPNAEAPRMEIEADLPLVVIQAIPQAEREAGGPVSRLYFMEEENQVTLAQLEQILRTDERVTEASQVFVQADELVPYGEVVRVLALVRTLGIEKLGLVTDPLTQTAQPTE